MNETKENLERALNIHSVLSDEDKAAVSSLESILNYGTKIHTNFDKEDKWPNIDGTFVLSYNNEKHGVPLQNFVIQIKSTNNINEKDEVIKYRLMDLAFPAYVASKVTLDPAILFIVYVAQDVSKRRFFWKEMSRSFLNGIDFNNDSVTITLTKEDEIEVNSITKFCDRLEEISKKHKFTSKLNDTNLTIDKVYEIIKDSSQEISERIKDIDFDNNKRDEISRKILNRLEDLCISVLLYIDLKNSEEKFTNISLAYERALLDIKTKFLCSFLRNIEYRANRVPESGQSERLMIKYYDYLYQIKKLMKDRYNVSILDNLNDYPINSKLDKDFYEKVSETIEEIKTKNNQLSSNRYIVIHSNPFFVNKQMYYEITLELAELAASKFNRITVYAKERISTDYSVKISYIEKPLDFMGLKTTIKILQKWTVSIKPKTLNLYFKLFNKSVKINTASQEYNALMEFLTKTGINLVELLDLDESLINKTIDDIFCNTNTKYFADLFLKLRKEYSKDSRKIGKYTLRYLLSNLKENYIMDVFSDDKKNQLESLFITRKCFPFENNPFIFNLTGRKTSEINSDAIIRIAGLEKYNKSFPYINLKNRTNK